MNVRDAVEADGGRLAALADIPTEVMANVIHDRTVRVADTNGDIDGFVGFEADEETVHVTHLFGTKAACEQLLDEPIRFAKKETMPVEILFPEPESDTVSVAERAGFEETEPGPWFDGHQTRRLRLENPSAEAE